MIEWFDDGMGWVYHYRFIFFIFLFLTWGQQGYVQIYKTEEAVSE